MIRSSKVLEADKIKRHIAERWKDDVAARVCNSIIDYIVSNPASRSRYLTYSALKRISRNVPAESDDVYRAAALLSSRFSVLFLHFSFIDDSGKEYPLEDDDAKLILLDGWMDHPETRQRITDIAEHLYPYYEGNKPVLMSSAGE